MCAALPVLASCQTPRTEIMVVVSTDFAVPSELDQVQMRVSSEHQTARFDQTYDIGPTRTNLPFSIALVPGSDRSITFRVVATGSAKGSRVVERSALTSFVPGQTLLLRLDLLRVCRNLTCAEGFTCLGGRCGSEGVDPRQLPRLGEGRDAAGGAEVTEAGMQDEPLEPAADADPDHPVDPADLPPDLGPDAPEPDSPPPDSPPDLPPDSPSDLAPDLPKDLPVDAPPDVAPADGPPGAPSSCLGLPSTCGPMASEDCCASPLVPGGTFSRKEYGMSYPATISEFRLDRFEITVGRLRKFVEAGRGTASSAPTLGAGAHPKVSGSGWLTSWNANLKPDTASLRAALRCDPSLATWTESPGPNENRPIGCIDWYEAFAFCIWDGGRLPTEAEWNYAAAGGSMQRTYPWGSSAPDVTRASYGDGSGSMCYGDGMSGCALSDLLLVGSKPAGDGRWGQSDLAGNVFEWTFDWAADYMTPCNDCAYALAGPSTTNRVCRGGGFMDAPANLTTLIRDRQGPGDRIFSFGSRCARAP